MIANLLREQLENIVTLYHGYDETDSLDKGLAFFSTDKEFSLNFGHYLYECKVNLGRVFDSMELSDIQKLYDYGFKLTDPYYKERGDKDNINYDYENDVYPTPADFIDGCLNNSWEAIEKTAGVIRFIFKNYDSIKLYEEGIINYFCDISRIVEKKLIRGKIKETIIKEDPDTVYIPKEHIHLGTDADDAIPFGIANGFLYIGERGDWHSNMLHRYNISDNIDDTDHYFDVAGRLWADTRVMTFWEFPSKNVLNGIINVWNKDKRYNHGIKIDFNWYMEVPDEVSSYSKLVKVKDYVRPNYKGWEEYHSTSKVPTGDYSSRAMGFHENIVKKLRLIKENPEAVVLPKEHIRLTTLSDGAVAFGYDKTGRLRISEKKSGHSQLMSRYGKKSKNTSIFSSDFDNSGRLWLDNKIISFWQFPREEELSQFVNDWNKEKKFNYGILLDGTWYVEIPASEDKPSTKNTRLVQIKDYKQPQYTSWNTIYNIEGAFNESVVNKLRNINESPDSIRLAGQNIESSWRDMLSYPFAYGEDGKMWIGRERGWHNDEDKHFNKEISTSKEYMAGRVFGQDRTISFWFFPSKGELNKIINDFNIVAKVKELPFRIDSSWYVELPKDYFGSYSKLVSVGDYEPPADFSSWMERLKAKVNNNFSTRDE